MHNTTHILIVTNTNNPEKIIESMKEIMTDEKVEAEMQIVYGVYDIVLKLTVGENDYEKVNKVMGRVKNIDKVVSVSQA